MAYDDPSNDIEALEDDLTALAQTETPEDLYRMREMERYDEIDLIELEFDGLDVNKPNQETAIWDAFKRAFHNTLKQRD